MPSISQPDSTTPSTTRRCVGMLGGRNVDASSIADDLTRINTQLKVLCTLKHDELKPVVRCCRRLRAAGLAARNYHFNYTTPSQAAHGAPPPTSSTSGAAHQPPARPRHAHGGGGKRHTALPPRATRAGSRLSKATRSSTSRTLHFATPRMLLGHA